MYSAGQGMKQPPAGITIRHIFAPGDLGELIRIHGLGNHADYGFGVRHEAFCARIAADFIIDGGGANGRAWLAWRDGQLVGSVFIADAGRGAAQLRLLYVEHSARGLGLGRWLVEAAVSYCRETGFRSVFLLTVEGLDRALHVYRDVGFTQVAREPVPEWGQPRPGARELRLELKLA